MPRKSAAAQEVEAQFGSIEVPCKLSRPPAPVELFRDEETEVWDAIVGALPGGTVTDANAHLLAQLCRHIVTARRLAHLVREQEHGEGEMDVDLWMRLLAAQRRESASIASLSSKLRLAPSSVYGPRRGARLLEDAPKGPRPWERTQEIT